MGFAIEKQEGRLYVVSIRPPNFTDELAEFRKQIIGPIVRRPDGAALFLNVTQASLLLPQVASGYTAIMREDSSKIIRSAIVTRDDMLGQQVARMVADAGSEKRRVFYSVKEAGQWLSEILTPVELKALDIYLLSAA